MTKRTKFRPIPSPGVADGPATLDQLETLIEEAGNARTEWRRYWTLVLAASIGFSFMSFMTSVTGIFMGPLETEFGWTRTQLSAGLALSPVISVLLSPFVGLLIDRLGVRAIALPGIVMTAAIIAAFSQLNGSFAQWITFWLVLGTSAMVISSTLWATAVARVFIKARGLALGITMAGTALAQVVGPPLANLLIGDFGWRSAFAILGGGWGAVALVLSFLFLKEAPFRVRIATHAQTMLVSEPTGLTIREAWRSTELWRVALATFLILSITIAVTVHQFPILTEAGTSRNVAALLVSLSGVAGICGKLVTGSLIDRYHARWIGGVTLASTAIAYPLLVTPIATQTTIIIGMMISGYAAGTKIQLCSYLTAQYAGVRNYGKIFGFMTSIISLSSMVGPLLAGLSHDRFGSYAPMLLAGVGLSLVSAGLLFSLPRYPAWPASTLNAKAR